MAAPTAKVGLSKGRLLRNSNKHKRLFDPDEPNGVKVHPLPLSNPRDVLQPEFSLFMSDLYPCGLSINLPCHDQ
jgi:hypothetical protein